MLTQENANKCKEKIAKLEVKFNKMLKDYESEIERLKNDQNYDAAIKLSDNRMHMTTEEMRFRSEYMRGSMKGDFSVAEALEKKWIEDYELLVDIEISAN